MTGKLIIEKEQVEPGRLNRSKAVMLCSSGLLITLLWVADYS